jgi:hypothetical protein
VQPIQTFVFHFRWLRDVWPHGKGSRRLVWYLGIIYLSRDILMFGIQMMGSRLKFRLRRRRRRIEKAKQKEQMVWFLYVELTQNMLAF